ncbi:MAG TPA: SRPBCC family protein [Terriglobales bacterium]|nr:SRPBCC family protein [Terriglobales bacterium]
MRMESTLFEPNRGEQRSDRYWGGFATGALIGTAVAATAYMVANALSSTRDHRIVRLEDSIQIGRPVEEVFRAWTALEALPDYIESIRNVQVQGSRSFWTAYANGKESKWEAETVQWIPNESIGWKSVSGPKNSGRITFSSIGDQTLLHVTMNYASPLGRLTVVAAPVTEHIATLLNEALRDFKAAMEGKASRRSEEPSSRASGDPARAEWRSDREIIKDDIRKQPGTVDYTRPPKAKYP